MSSQPSATIPSLGETLGALYVGATVAAMQGDLLCRHVYSFSFNLAVYSG